MNTPTRMALGFAVLLIIVVAGYNLLLTDGSSAQHHVTIDDTSTLSDAGSAALPAVGDTPTKPTSQANASTTGTPRMETASSTTAPSTPAPSGLLLAQVRQYAGEHLGTSFENTASPTTANATDATRGNDTAPTSPSAGASDAATGQASVFGNDVTNAITSDAPETTEASADATASATLLTTPAKPPTITFGSEPTVPEDTYDSGALASAAVPPTSRTEETRATTATPDASTDAADRPSTSLFDRIDTSQYASATRSSPAIAPTTSAPVHTTPGEVPSSYTIKPGDSFSSIAEKYYGKERYWVEIEAANPGVNSSKLQLGQVIKLPPKDAVIRSDSDTAAAAAPASSSTSIGKSAPTSPSSSETTHTIQPGDTLSSIAQKYYGSANKWRAIFKANQKQLGNNPNHLRAGDVLVIPKSPDDEK